MATPKPASPAPAAVVKLYDALVATLPGVERKGATVPYTSHNGHMFSYLSKTGTMALRLPPDARQAFLDKYGTRLCQQYGIVQKEYVEVPPALLARTAEMRKHFAVSFAFVKAMRPKPTKRPAKRRVK
jgi:hypothetical protein